MHTVNRRTLVAGASLATISIPIAGAVTAAAPDPIYAVIEAHRQADANFSAVLRHISAIEQAHYDDVTRVPGSGYPKRSELIAMEAEASDAEHDALFDLLELPATTAAGLVAGLRYLQGIDPSDGATACLDRCGAPELFFDGLVEAIERVTS